MTDTWTSSVTTEVFESSTNPGIVFTTERVDGTGPPGPPGTGGGGGGAVDSVNGATGVVVLDAGDVGAATTAQGALADTATQPGDPIDGAQIQSGFVPDIHIPASIARDSEVTSAIGAITPASIGAATSAQGTKADSALQAASTLDGSKVTTGIVPDANIASTIARDSEVTAAVAAVTTSSLGAVPTSRTVTAGTGLTGGGDLTADRTLSVSYGTTGTTAAAGNDVRLSDTRTPTDATITAAKFATNVLDTDATLAANSDTRIPSQKAVKTALAGKIGGDGTITKVISMTQAAYNLITPVSTTLYVVTP